MRLSHAYHERVKCAGSLNVTPTFCHPWSEALAVASQCIERVQTQYGVCIISSRRVKECAYHLLQSRFGFDKYRSRSADLPFLGKYANQTSAIHYGLSRSSSSWCEIHTDGWQPLLFQLPVLHTQVSRWCLMCRRLIEMSITTSTPLSACASTS